MFHKGIMQVCGFLKKKAVNPVVKKVPEKRNGYTIFVADDDPVAQVMIMQALLGAGYDVDVMGNGQEVLANLKENKPDLLILDVMMPGINGYEVAYKIKFNSSRPDLPIIILTSDKQIMDHRFGLLLDIDYLHKPCSCGDLLLKVNSILHVV
ncbi:MAG: response regulator [Chlorobium sp.]